MARQRKPRDEEEQILQELADRSGAQVNSCGSKWCPVGTTTGSFSSITNVGTLDITIDISETTVTNIDNFPTSDFVMAPGTTLVGDFTSVGVINTFSFAAFDPLFNVIAAKKC